MRSEFLPEVASVFSFDPQLLAKRKKKSRASLAEKSSSSLVVNWKIKCIHVQFFFLLFLLRWGKFAFGCFCFRCFFFFSNQSKGQAVVDLLLWLLLWLQLIAIFFLFYFTLPSSREEPSGPSWPKIERQWSRKCEVRTGQQQQHSTTKSDFYSLTSTDWLCERRYVTINESGKGSKAEMFFPFSFNLRLR